MRKTRVKTRISSVRRMKTRFQSKLRSPCAPRALRFGHKPDENAEASKHPSVCDYYYTRSVADTQHEHGVLRLQVHAVDHRVQALRGILNKHQILREEMHESTGAVKKASGVMRCATCLDTERESRSRKLPFLLVLYT